MKRLALGMTATTCLILAGCGAPSGQGNPVTQGSANTPPTTSNSTGTSQSVNSSNSTTSASAAPISLQPYTGFQGQGLTVSVPAGWSPSTTVGGDYKTVVFSNPADRKEQVRIEYSTCVGCYMNSSGKPDPTLVIAEEQKTNVSVSPQSPLVASYEFSKANNPYQGRGKVQVSRNQTGYAEIDVILSQQNQALCDKILSSFKFSS